MTDSPEKNEPAHWGDETGFKYVLFPAKEKKAEHLIIYLHGLGSNAEMNEDFLRAMREKIPCADIISLQAPIKVNLRIPHILDNPRGYSWLHLGESILSHIFNRLTIAEKVEQFARHQLEKRGLKEDNLAYFGTSMGGIVALQAGLSGDRPVAGVVSRSGAVLPFTRVKSKTKVFLQMGGADKLFYGSFFPKGFLKNVFSRVARILSFKHGRSVERLKKQGVDLTEKVYPKQGHTLNKEAWNDSVDFIAKALRH